jgi:hypothetical protein
MTLSAISRKRAASDRKNWGVTVNPFQVATRRQQHGRDVGALNGSGGDRDMSLRHARRNRPDKVARGLPQLTGVVLGVPACIRRRRTCRQSSTLDAAECR